MLALAIAVLLGGLGQVLLQWPQLRARRVPVSGRRRAVAIPALREILLLMGPGTLGVAATQFNVYVNTVLATSQQAGAVSWLDYAFRIMYLPIGIFGVSIASAVAADDLAPCRAQRHRRRCGRRWRTRCA